MIVKLQEVAKQYSEILHAHGAHEPDWGPLEKVLPLKWCPGFMFMGYSGKIRMYKHGFTRRYLHADPEGNTYMYAEGTDSYFRVPRTVAIDHVFGGLKQMGVPRSTPFDDKARRKRQNALAKAGWTMVNVDVTKGKEPTVIRGEESQAGSS